MLNELNSTLETHISSCTLDSRETNNILRNSLRGRVRYFGPADHKKKGYIKRGKNNV